ncbi:probable G-protein coupled receptor Mth-like 1 isoform X2 [Achroia grisella]|uniref:probable G-protein coupled receptor Mth-like 1 isoform X2 n=1 Tax=Achroia grisella TaxID=688607 RepID=UPI0027D32A90|nr:probable G-protein coupled receptor Mth-like 1 isoform X2 [Achroia grisella]
MKHSLFLVLISCGVALSAKQCCPNGEILRPKGFCGDTHMETLNCKEGKLLLRDVILKGDKVSTVDTPNFVFVDDPEQYCIGNMYRDIENHENGTIPVAIVCFEKIPKTNKDYEVSGILTLISVVFLLGTVLVYSYFPQLRDVQGLCYMCMCISMAFGFLMLGTSQLSRWYSGDLCTTTAFLLYTWMMATFFWMNVICINVYRTARDPTYMKKTERKQYFWYSCYAWGGTFVFLMVAVITNFMEGDHWKPGFNRTSCWFADRTETWIFFYGPIAVLITTNIVLFILSSYTICQNRKQYEANKVMILKHTKITDTINCLQGVTIFVILVVLRRRAIRGLVNESCCLRITRPLAEKLSPNDEECDQHILADDTVEVRLN